MRIGHGYDVHRFAENRALILGGVTIPYELGLLGHSDADVLSHAISDALLGALSLGDIGQHFPDNDDRYKDADSIKLLQEVCRLIEEKGYKIVNIDSTILCQKPKLKNFIVEMRKRLSDAMNIDIEDVSVKATTEEGLGFTGEGLGIAVHAVCLLEKY
ncbi:MAG: 2-C-methyl-D-erythritol 2,4-cyclodiphosphate synthase [Eubacteriales bacterium]|nr:2-C-methyl-D-erythritol 2,4-cyclodiphosphate synthase [Eubacteriales bacterium]